MENENYTRISKEETFMYGCLNKKCTVNIRIACKNESCINKEWMLYQKLISIDGGCNGKNSVFICDQEKIHVSKSHLK